MTQPASVTSRAHFRSSELVSPASNGCSRQTSARQEDAWFEKPQRRCARTCAASWWKTPSGAVPSGRVWIPFVPATSSRP
jgi:hypothetical protein